jgi:hypothetical protein
MTFYLIKTYLLFYLKSRRKISLKFLQFLLIICTIVLFYHLITNPRISVSFKQNYKTNLEFIFFIVLLFLFYKIRLFEHKILFIIPIKQYKLTLNVILFNLLRLQTFLLVFVSYIFVFGSFPKTIIYLKVFYTVVYTLLLSLSFLNTKMAINIKSKNIIDYLSFLFSVGYFLYQKQISMCFLLILICFFRINRLILTKLTKIKISELSIFNFQINKNPLLNKEIKLLIKNKKGIGLLISSFLSFIFFAAAYLFIGPHLNRIEGLEIFIFMNSSGYLMAEYFQYIFSWDYKNSGSLLTLPINYLIVVTSKFKIINILVLAHSLCSFSIIGFSFFPHTIYLLFILNYLLLPHFYIIIAFSSFKKDMFIEKSILNINYYHRPLKLLIFISILFICEYLMFFIFPINEIKIFLILLIALIVFLYIIYYKKLMNFYAEFYSNWLKKFTDLKDSTFAF